MALGSLSPLSSPMLYVERGDAGGVTKDETSVGVLSEAGRGPMCVCMCVCEAG
jgi:hypothetical protein